MKRLVLYLFVIFISTAAIAQNNQPNAVDELHKLLSKTRSFKAQIKGDKKKDYNFLVTKLKAEYASASTDWQRFQILSQLFHPIRDNHLNFYSNVNSVLQLIDFDKPEIVKAYRASRLFQEHPRVKENLDSLEVQLNGRTLADVEGVYYHTDSLKIGIFRTARRDSIVGVVLDTKLLNWDVGQIFCQLTEFAPNKFRAIYFHPTYKNMTIVKTEKYIDGRLTEGMFYGSLTTLPLSKKLTTIDFSNIPRTEPLFILKPLDENTSYLRLGNFNASDRSLAESNIFYQKIKDSLTTRNLIVDLRNNGGGGFKNSKKFLKMLQKFDGKIYLLLNNRTFSNAEQFAIELAKEKNVVTLGEATNGTLTYGSNYGKHTPIENGRYRVYLTDMKDSGNYLPYEQSGFTPEIILSKNFDWIQQVSGIILNNK